MEKGEIKLLFITQRLDFDDPDLAFVISWIDELIRQGVDVKVLCLKKGRFDDHFPVYSLGKEKGLPKWRWVINFYKLIFSLKYNRVFVHMNPEWGALGGWYWKLSQRPFYLWYTHYTMTPYLKMTAWLAKKMFCATSQSLPQYQDSPKKIVTGHGIDLRFWHSTELLPLDKRQEENILMVHRLSRSKRVELAIEALTFMPDNYNLTIYGRTVPGEENYIDELKDLALKLKVENRVKFMGAVPMPELKRVYGQHRILLNMASETIDKTMLEAMYYGAYPVTTKGNSRAIGLLLYPSDDEPQTLAKFILSGEWKRFGLDDLKLIVEDRHSLPSLIKKIISYF